jgi:O-antigen ligase
MLGTTLDITLLLAGLLDHLPALLMVLLAAFALFWHSRFGEDLSALSAIAVALLAGALATVTMNGVRPSAHVALTDAFLLAVAIITLPRLAFFGPPSGALPGWFVACSLLMSVFAVLSSIGVQPDTRTNLIAAAEFLTALVGVPLLISMYATSAERLALFSNVWIAFAALNALAGVTDFLKITAFSLLLTGDTRSDRFSGLSSHPNHLALVCAMALPVALFYFGNSRRLVARLALAAEVILLLLGVLVSGSRAGIACSAVVIVIQMLFQGRILRSRIVVLAALAVFAGVWVAASSETRSADLLRGLHRLTGEESVGASDAERIEMYDRAITDFKESPLLGTGMRNVRHAHNIYLQLAQSGGIDVLGTFAVYIAATFYLAWKLSLDKLLNTSLRGLALALAFSVGAWLIQGLWQNAVYDRYLYVPVGLLLGMRSFATARTSDHESSRTNDRPDTRAA